MGKNIKKYRSIKNPARVGNINQTDTKKIAKELVYIEQERGMISALVHIRNICNICIKAHREGLKKLIKKFK